MRRISSRTGVSKAAVPVVIIMVIVVAAAYLFLARSSTAPPSSSASSVPTVPMGTAVNQFVQELNARSVDGMTTFYTSSSVVHWSGNLGGLQGLYAGTDNIRLLYASTVGKTMSMNASSSNFAQDVFSPTRANATYDLYMLANSTVAGTLNATISVSQEWNWGNSGWQISRENWAYTHFFASLLSAKYGSVTTFPQWGYAMEGGNPNLVSEKSFEWHAGPYLAAAVFAFLFGVVAVTALRFRSMGRGAGP
ncbi:MAG TPA: hypothetical protein VND41_03065 [Nitrososphaerales archaeon]|nr:hypothetical protein [Nitrososphaerales archaeon]